MSAEAATNGAVAAGAAANGPVGGSNPSPAAGAAPAAAAPWYGEIADPELKGWTENKKFATPSDALKSAREAEKLIGVPKDQLLRIPAADAKPEEIAAFHRRQGWPEKPDDYKLPEGMEVTDFAKGLLPVLHEAKLTQAQLAVIAPKWQAYVDGLNKNQQAALEADVQKNWDDLGREWGPNVLQERIEIARRVARTFDGDEQTLAALEGILGGAGKAGNAKLVKFLSEVGMKSNILEHKTAGMDNRSGADFGKTPDGAREEQRTLMADPAFREKAMNKDSAEFKRLEQLARIQAGGQR